MHLIVLAFVLGFVSMVLGEELKPTTEHPVRNCLSAKQACDHDEECVHRIVYLHSTCTLSSSSNHQHPQSVGFDSSYPPPIPQCSVDCRSAVMNLYQLPLGRALLLSDLNCVPMVKPQLMRCHLVPTQSPLYCSLAKMHCDNDERCKQLKNMYMSSCEYKLSNGECPSKCASMLLDLYDTSGGSALSECVCWANTRDTICDRFQSLLSICGRQLYNLQQINRTNSTSVDQTVTMQDSHSTTVSHSLSDSHQTVVGNGLHEMQRLSTDNNSALVNSVNHWTLFTAVSLLLNVIQR